MSIREAFFFCSGGTSATAPIVLLTYDISKDAWLKSNEECRHGRSVSSRAWEPRRIFSVFMSWLSRLFVGKNKNLNRRSSHAFKPALHDFNPPNCFSSYRRRRALSSNESTAMRSALTNNKSLSLCADVGGEPSFDHSN